MEGQLVAGQSRERTEEAKESQLESVASDVVMDAFKEPKIAAEEVASVSEKMAYGEHPYFAIAQALRDNGYGVADYWGSREPSENTSTYHMGVLKNQGYRKFLGLFKVRNDGLHIGSIVFDHRDLANHHTNWLVEVHGREYTHELAILLKKFAENYNVKVNFVLVSEKPKGEDLVWNAGKLF